MFIALKRLEFSWKPVFDKKMLEFSKSMVRMRGNSLCLPAVNFRKTTLYLHSSAVKRCFVEIRLIYVLFLIIWKMKLE